MHNRLETLSKVWSIIIRDKRTINGKCIVLLQQSNTFLYNEYINVFQKTIGINRWLMSLSINEKTNISQFDFFICFYLKEKSYEKNSQMEITVIYNSYKGLLM